MRILIVSLLILISVLLEATVFQYFRIFGVLPDFCIILIISYAILRGKWYGTLVGLGSGLLLDIMFGCTIGLNALSYMLTGYLFGQFHENVFKDSYIPAILFNIAAVFVSQNIYLLLAYFSSNLDNVSLSYIQMLLRFILPQCLYNGILGGVIYRYVLWLDERQFMNKRLY